MATLLTQGSALCGAITPARLAGRDGSASRRTSKSCRASIRVRSSADEDPLLLRVARGEQGERPPVWLMRQAGRYMAEFREYSNKLLSFPTRRSSDLETCYNV